MEELGNTTTPPAYDNDTVKLYITFDGGDAPARAIKLVGAKAKRSDMSA
jgi:hypothetical protein